MLCDGETVGADEIIDCDICVIGGGAAGLTIARDLLGSGRKVVVLEAGGEKPEADSQSFYEGDVASPLHAAPDMYRQRRLGGSSTIWGGRCVPFDPIDFVARDWVPMSGWPYSRETIDPYYARAQVVLDAGSFDYSATTALQPGALLEGFADPRLSTDTIERFSLPTNLWKSLREALVAADDVTIMPNAACIGLPAGEAGAAVERCEVASPSGKRFAVRARHYVVAAGGIETVRILGTAGPGRAGLGNQGDMLGRTYMCHLELGAGTLRITPANRPVSYGFEFTRDGIYARRRFTLTADRQRELGVMNVMARLHHASVVDPAHRDPILSLMYVAKNTVIPEYRRKLSMIEHAAAGGLQHDPRFWSAHAWNIVRGSPQTAAFVMKWITKRILARRKLPYVALHNVAGLYAVDMNVEQAPNRDSRIILTDQCDRNGVPRVRIDWRITDLDVRSAVVAYAELDAALRASGTGAIDYDRDRIEAIARNAAPVGGHHMGTARMASDPTQGVVDADCKVHGVANLHVAGAAVLPTSSHANPTLTLVALAIRLADRLRHISGQTS